MRSFTPGSCWLIVLLGSTLIGCGPGPLVRVRDHQGCPWCEPGKQTRLGLRSMGKSFYGDIWRERWVDPSRREYDPFQVSEQVWDYLRSTGDVARIEAALRAKKCSEWMRIVSVDPIIVIMIPCQHERFTASKVMTSHGTRMAMELAYTPTDLMYFSEPMRWLSPDLKQGPTVITFSDKGEAEIPLKNGKLKLVHEGERCKISRE